MAIITNRKYINSPPIDAIKDTNAILEITGIGRGNLEKIKPSRVTVGYPGGCGTPKSAAAVAISPMSPA